MRDLERSPTPTLFDIVSSYGEVEARPLSRIQAIVAKTVARNWASIPQVTHFDRIDVTALEDGRRRVNADRAPEDRLSPLPFLLKAVAGVLGKLPTFNAAFEAAGDRLLLRRYVNVGLAIDTPRGLVVGVLRGCSGHSLDDLAAEAKRLGEKARSQGLSLAEMSGSGFTVSSLGELGGAGFTPIVNAPEVAILGVGRISDTACRTRGGTLEWRRFLPVCLSYDHRVINGADAGRFMLELQAEVSRLADTRVRLGARRRAQPKRKLKTPS